MVKMTRGDVNPGNPYPRKALTKKSPGLACGLVLLSILACRFFTVPELAPTPSPTPVPGVDELRFADAETGRRFRSLIGYINDFIDETWRTTSYHMTGNFYESSWCRGAGASPDCQVANSTIDNRDQHIIELYTLFYQDFPKVYGLGFYVHWVPMETGWGASFSFSEGGSTTVGDGWGVGFYNYTTSTGPPEATLTLGWGYSYKIYQTSIDYSPGLPERDDLALYLAGPQAMRDRGLTQIQALATKVKTQINTHQVMTCDWQPYQGGGIPPLCKTRPMTPAEEAAELARAEVYFTDQEQLLRDHYQEMYTAWMTAFPLDQYWP
jgi:hypothetical protein